jgi:hypothetical protein
MLTNKDAGMVEPDQETLNCINKIKEFKTLADKIEQIGFETQTLFLNAFMGNISKKFDEEKLDQVFGNIWYYMNYLRTLVPECRNIENMINNNSELITLLNGNEDRNKQYILFTNINKNNKFQCIKGNEFLELFSKEYFKHIDIFTTNDFDEICLDTKEMLKNNINIEKTDLYKLLEEIENEEIFIWSGKEYNLLADIKNFKGLIEYIKMILVEGKYGINIYYKKREK